MKKFWIVPLAALAFGSACGDGSSTTTEPQFTPGGLLKDDIYNKIDGTIDAVAEVLPLNKGVQSTTTLYVDATGNDGKNGCNFQGKDEVLVVSVSSTNTSIATVSPATVTFGGCGDQKTLTITAVAVGSATISLTQTSNNTGATFRLDRATFTVEVSAPAPANTAPTLTVGGVTAGGQYMPGTVLAPVCNVTDAEDGNTTFAASVTQLAGPYVADGVGTQTASCSYTDKGGISTSASISYAFVYDDDSAPDITWALDPSNPDGLNGWYKNNVSLAWFVTESSSPASLVKTGCVDQNITADQAATDYKCAATSAGGSAAEITRTIKRDATRPTAAYTSATSQPDGQNDWYLGDVTASFTATDNLSGFGNPATLTTTGTATTTGEGAAVKVSSPAFTDNAGNSALSVESDAFKVDKTDPTASATLSTQPNAKGWHNDDVTVTFSGSDVQSGVAGCDADVTITSEGKGQPASGKCRDNAGRVSVAATVNIDLDRTAPTVAYTSATPSPSAYGWYNQNVTATFTASDNLSGFDAAGTLTKTGTASTSGEGSNVEASSPAFTDEAGNTVAAGAAKKGFKIDQTKPTSVAFVGGPMDGGTYYFGSVPAEPTCSANDALSGLAGCEVTGYGNIVGTYTLIATATDKAGNSEQRTLSYTVKAWTLNGFYQPVDMQGVLNTVKAGSTVPLKFEVFAGPTELTATSAIKSFGVTTIACSNSAPSDEIELTTTGGTVLRYDVTGGQFIQNWQTPTKPGSCFRVTMTTQDGSPISALFKLK